MICKQFFLELTSRSKSKAYQPSLPISSNCSASVTMANQQEQKPLLSNNSSNPRIQELTQEKDSLDSTFCNAKKLLSEAIEKEQSGKKNGATGDRIISIVPTGPARISCRVRIPVGEYPKFNYVGKLLGPKGSTLKQLQLDTGTRMSILGRNSMRDKNKEEELRNSGDPKFAHLSMELHMLVEAYCPAAEAHSRLGHALAEVQKYLTPDPEEDERQGMGMGASPRGAMGRGAMGRGRGGPPGRGMPRPLVGASPRGGLSPSPRGAPRGAPRGGLRGAPRGSPMGAPRGAPRGRGAQSAGRGRAAPRPLAGAYGQQEGYQYDESAYGESYAETGYEDGSTAAGTYGYEADTGAGDGYEYGGYGGAAQSASYGQSTGSTAGSYGGYGGGAGGPRQQLKAPSPYAQKPAARAHPYQRY